MTVRRASAISRPVLPQALLVEMPFFKEKAQGRPDANRTRSLVRKNKNTRVSHHRYAATFRPSLRNGFTAYSALSLVTGLCCHHRQRNAQALSPT
jgi:hypothetical protein